MRTEDANDTSELTDANDGESAGDEPTGTGHCCPHHMT